MFRYIGDIQRARIKAPEADKQLTEYIFILFVFKALGAELTRLDTRKYEIFLAIFPYEMINQGFEILLELLRMSIKL